MLRLMMTVDNYKIGNRARLSSFPVNAAGLSLSKASKTNRVQLEFEPSANVDLQQLLDSDSNDNTVYGDRRGTKQNHEVMEQRNKMVFQFYLV